MEKHVKAVLIIVEIYWIEYFKIVFLNIYNCVYKTPFAYPVAYVDVIFPLKEERSQFLLLIHFCMFTWCRYAIIYEKGYQTTEEVVSAVTTKVVGIGYTNGTGQYTNAGNRVWDSSDYVVPPQVWSQITWCQWTFIYLFIPFSVTQQCVHHDKHVAY